MEQQRAPEDVFTPKAIVTREMFARRNEQALDGTPGLQDSLRDALRERGGQVLLFGDTGVGKSSLLRYAAEDEGMATLTVECTSEKKFSDLIEDGIRRLVSVKELTRSAATTTTAATEASGGLPLLSLKGSLTGQKGKTRQFEVVQKPPLDALIDAMKATQKQIIVFDNFHNLIDEPSRTLVAQMMEVLADRASGPGDIKVAVIGIAEDAASLLGGSGSYMRRTNEIGVPHMPDGEIEEIILRGFGLLGLQIPEEVLRNMVFMSDGFPFFAHLLGLQCARAARREETDFMTARMFESSLTRVAQAVDRSLSLRARYALEAGGQVQPRRRILSILAASNRREWTSGDVISVYSRQYESKEHWNFLRSALAQLTNETYGGVLRRTGGQGGYRYRFADPHMRPYLRISETVDPL